MAADLVEIGEMLQDREKELEALHEHVQWIAPPTSSVIC